MALKCIASLVFLLVLAGCVPAPEIEVISNPATAPVQVNPAEAARILSAIRAEHGLPPVIVNPTLTVIAKDYAEILAVAGAVHHNLDSTLQMRLAAGGYQFVVAGENLGGGFRLIDEAYERWVASPSHFAILVDPLITEIGIATAFNIDSPFRTFWVLLVGLPGV